MVSDGMNDPVTTRTGSSVTMSGTSESVLLLLQVGTNHDSIPAGRVRILTEGVRAGNRLEYEGTSATRRSIATSRILMHIGILQADRVDSAQRARFGDYPAMFAATLRGGMEREATFEFFDVRRERYPRRIEDCGGYLITGSRASVYDDDAWIARLIGFVRKLHGTGTKTVGICFGHQLIAQALGGTVGRASGGWGVGVHAWTVLRHESWMHPPIPEIRLLASHQDQVETLPSGARLLASSTFCPHAAFAVGNHILALQGHPEFTKSYAEFLMRKRRPLLGAAFEPGMRSLDHPTDEGVVAGLDCGVPSGRRKLIGTGNDRT